MTNGLNGSILGIGGIGIETILAFRRFIEVYFYQGDTTLRFKDDHDFALAMIEILREESVTSDFLSDEYIPSEKFMEMVKITCEDLALEQSIVKSRVTRGFSAISRYARRHSTTIEKVVVLFLYKKVYGAQAANQLKDELQLD